jgi:aminoglycoside phosphotransferase (APT) family kinase protein
MVEYQTINRTEGAFQEPVTSDQLLAMCRRAFGSHVRVRSAQELGGGLYNSTFSVDIGQERPVVLRIAPEPRKQWRSERELMRNEYASVPFFASVSAMMPRVLFADWSHEIAGRDYIWQTMLDGVPAHEALHTYPTTTWSGFYEQVGTIAKTIHNVRGKRFGRICGPHYDTWSEAVVHTLEETICDLESAGFEADDVRNALSIVAHHKAIFDEINEPRLLHGDLWVPNLMLQPGTSEPTIIGILDHDRSSWGDPMADWVVFMVQRRRERSEREAFWRTYGALPRSTTHASWRSLIYRAAHLAAIRLELIRLGRTEQIPQNCRELGEALHLLA